MSIICHLIWCTNCIITYINASYRIAGGSTSSGTRGAGQGRPIENPGTGGARGRGARRGSARVRGPSTWFLQKRQVPEHYKSATYQVETGPPMQTWKLLIWVTQCWSKGAHGRVGGGICKSVIRSERLSVKLPNPPAPLGSTSCGLDSKFLSLHRWSGFHLIHCLISLLLYKSK
jgi:hypothetical protein